MQVGVKEDSGTLLFFEFCSGTYGLVLFTGIQGTGDQTKEDHEFNAACVSECAFERTKWICRVGTCIWNSEWRWLEIYIWGSLYKCLLKPRIYQQDHSILFLSFALIHSLKALASLLLVFPKCHNPSSLPAFLSALCSEECFLFPFHNLAPFPPLDSPLFPSPAWSCVVLTTRYLCFSCSINQSWLLCVFMCVIIC